MFIDLTQTFTSTMPVYPGDSAAILVKDADVDIDGCEGHTVTSGMHVGTHMDAPLHMISGGKTIPELPLESFFGPGVLLDARGKEVIDADVLENYTIPAGSIVLVWTDFDSHFRDQDYYYKFPCFSEDFAHALVESKVKIVGMDTPSPDRDPFPVHKILLGANILLLENLTNLQALDAISSFEVIALPAKFAAEGAFLRVIARN